MRYSFLFKWKFLQVFFFIGALIGAFFLGRCSKPDHMEQPSQIEQAGTSIAIDEEGEQSEEKAPASRISISAEHYSETCGEGVLTPLRTVVAELEAESIRYGTSPLSDCSGIFHRVLQKLQQRCPEHDYPPVATHRDSRDLARWYYERGELVLIESALERPDVIMAGTILFYGQNGSVYKDFTAEELFQPQTGIDHVGVVVQVHKNSIGEVINYGLFHGYGKKGMTTASTTDWHRRQPTRSKYPPFGNGRQQLVAAAPLLSPVRQAKPMANSAAAEQVTSLRKKQSPPPHPSVDSIEQERQQL